MKVFVAGYKGTNTDDILGVFKNIEDAKLAIYKDYVETKFDNVPYVREVDDNHIYIAQKGSWFDEWYIVETELHNN